MAKEYKLSDIFGKIIPKRTPRKVHREINLVPDIKNEMIKTLKLRNFIFFICIVVASASVVVSLIFGLTAGGQQLAINNKKDTIDNLSSKLNSYADLSDFLTIKDQLSDVATLTDQRQVFSRTFNILSALLPTGADTIQISEMDVDLTGEYPSFSFDAQANSGTEPFIDFAVLESFRKSMDEMRYDYGSYVDKEGNIIPSYCMIESGSDGATFTDTSKRGLASSDANSIYAYWTITGEGCNPSAEDEDEDETSATEGYDLEEYDGQKVVKIWRTPQKEWYQNGQISLDGQITGIPHFESACTTYSGEEDTNNNVTWTKTNDSCKLVPGGRDEGIEISEATNGRDANEQLVLRFSAVIYFAPEVFQFNNTHMLAVAPSGRHNVTDSYLQVQAMFSQRATDCDADDTSCLDDTENSGSDQTQTNNQSSQSSQTDSTTNKGGK